MAMRNSLKAITKQILSVLLCAGLLFGLCSCKSEIAVTNKNTVGNSLENIDADGFMAIQDDYMFFYQVSPNEGLYRSKLDGSDKTKLDSGFISDINVIDDKIYYIKTEFVRNIQEEVIDLYSYSLYSIDINGKDETKLIENCSQVYTTSDYIYYLFEIDRIAYKYDKKPIPENQNYLYRYNIKDKTTELIVDKHIHSYRIDNDNVLFVTNEQDKIYSKVNNASVLENSVVFDAKAFDKESIDAFVPSNGNKLFICDGYTIFSFDSDTSNIKEMYKADGDNSFSEFVLTDKFIYAIDHNRKIQRINLDNMAVENLFEIEFLNDSTPRLYLFNNQCYYYDGINQPKSVEE